MRAHYTDEDGPELSDALKKKFHEALKGKLHTRTCRDCPQARGFVQVVEFLIDMMTDATGRMDIASQRMESFIELFHKLGENEMKNRMKGGDGL